jgi:hypothetical protein
MADSKVSELTAATSVNSADVLYLIQSSTDKKISMSTLLANLPNTLTKFSGLIALSLNSAQSIVGSGAINSTTFMTTISNAAGTYALTIADGTYVGQLKLIMCSSASGTSSITSNLKGCTAAFTETGHTLLLVWYDNDWWPIGGTATLTF